MPEINFNKTRLARRCRESALAGNLGGSAEVAAKCERDMCKSDKIIARTMEHGRWTFFTPCGDDMPCFKAKWCDPQKHEKCTNVNKLRVEKEQDNAGERDGTKPAD